MNDSSYSKDKIESLLLMINHVKSKKSFSRLDNLLVINWERSIKLIIDADNRGD